MKKDFSFTVKKEINSSLISSATIKKLSFSQTEVPLKIGNSFTLEPNLTNIERSSLIYTSTDSNIASVSSDGVITAVRRGECNIEVTVKNSLPKATVKVVVTEDLKLVTNIRTARDSLSVIKEKETTFSVLEVSPSDAINKGYNISIEDPELAKVETYFQANAKNTYLITGLKEGQTNIIISSNDKNYTKKLPLTVEANSLRGGGFMVRGTTPADGWFDANKRFDAFYGDHESDEGLKHNQLRGDKQLCWGATVSNLVDWYQNGLVVNNIFTKEDFVKKGIPYGPKYKDDGQPIEQRDNNETVQGNVFEYMREKSLNQGHEINRGLDWFFTGSDFIPGQAETGKGLYSEFFGSKKVSKAYDMTSRGSREEYIAYLKQVLSEAVDKGYGIGLALSIKGGGHAITCYGYELSDLESPNEFNSDFEVTDKALASQNGDYLIGRLYLVDSDDAEDPTAKFALIRAPIVYRDDGIFLTYKTNNNRAQLKAVHILELEWGKDPRL